MDHGDLSTRTQKRSILRKLLGEHNVIRLFIASSTEGLVLPPKCFQESVAQLDIGYGMHKPMAGFRDEERIEATLSFGGTMFHCIVPWDAIFGIGPEPEPERTAFWPAFAPGMRVRVVQRDVKPANAQVVNLADYRKRASSAGPTTRMPTPPRRPGGNGGGTPPRAS